MKQYDKFPKGIGDSKFQQNAFDDLMNCDKTEKSHQAQ